MSLFKPGDRICGRFVVEAPIDTGDRSKVYRGRDEKLHDRPVAIKILRKHGLERDELGERIQAEVRVLSGLTHPHVAVLYDVCRHEQLDVAVMELIEGDTLATVLRRTRLPAAVALRYAAQVADALAYAHRHGVVHGNVNPNNIVVTSRGAKLVNFSLANLTDTTTVAASTRGDRRDADASASAFYTAPEQALGAERTQQADIYSFGLVLLEMLTGFRPDVESGLSARIVVGGLLMQVASSPLRLVLERCVASNPEERWLHATDLHVALLAVAEAPSYHPSNEPSARRFFPWSGLAVVVAVAAIALLLVRTQRPVAPSFEYQFTISPPPGTHFISLEAGGPAAISPDGGTVAFVAADPAGVTRIWTRALNTVEATPLQGTEGAAHLFWSPDSRFIGFFTPGRLQRIAASGGSVRTITDAAQGRGGTWSAAGVIVFAPGFTQSLLRVSAEGGDIRPATTIVYSNRETSHRWPTFLPDGRRYLFHVRSDRPDVAGLYLGSLDSSERTRIADIRTSAVFAPISGEDDGYLVFSHGGFLTAQPFSTSQGRLIGGMVRILSLPAPEEDTSVSPVSVSNSGVLVYGGGSTFRQRLIWVDREGRELETISAQGQYRNVRLSPDGRSVALERLEIRTGLANAWLFELDRNVQHPVGVSPGGSYAPIWSPDGKSLLFAWYRDAQWDLVRRDRINASDVAVVRPGSLRESTERPAQTATDWSHDGKWVIYQERVPGNQWDLGALEIATGQERSLLSTAHNEYLGRLSPDGSWLAFTSDESGRDEVYVQRFPSMARRFRISTSGGSQPKWRADGRELFYVDPSLALMSVNVDVRTDTLGLSASRSLFRADLAPAAGLVFVSNYDVARTGERFLLAAPAEAQNLHQHVTVIINWPAELQAQ